MKGGLPLLYPSGAERGACSVKKMVPDHDTWHGCPGSFGLCPLANNYCIKLKIVNYTIVQLRLHRDSG